MRKQLLLGTTALLAGSVVAVDYAAAEDPVRVQVRGYKNEFFGIGDVDSGVSGIDYNFSNHFSDGEVHFRGETTLDNGLTVGVQIELESNSGTGDFIDENYAYIKGDFGQIVAGSENLANYNTFWAATAPGVGIPINSGWITVFAPAPTGWAAGVTGGGFRSPGLTTNLDIGNDENAISYYSPRFAGFQFTGGYAPTVADTGDGAQGQAIEQVQYHNAWGVGLNFQESFNGVDVAVAGGYNRSTVPDLLETLFNSDDQEQLKFGANIGVAGFSIGGSYANELEGKTSGGGSTEGQSFDAGASYSTGPWGVSVTYFHGEVEGSLADPDDDEVDAIVGAVSYALGPGITTSLSLFHAEYDEEGGVDSDATVGIVGLAIKF